MFQTFLDINNEPQETFREEDTFPNQELRRDTDHTEYCIAWHSDIRLSGQQSVLPRGGSGAVKEPGAALFACERSLLIPRLVNVNESRRCCCVDVTGRNFWRLEQVGGKPDVTTRLRPFRLQSNTWYTNLYPVHVTGLWWRREKWWVCPAGGATTQGKQRCLAEERMGNKEQHVIPFFYF